MCICSNAILLCDGDGCMAAVHQQCYGVASIPEGEWRCDGCMAGLNPAASHCLLCPVTGGALRSVSSLGTAVPPRGKRAPFDTMHGIKPVPSIGAVGCANMCLILTLCVAGRGRQLWVHSACALWVPEVTLQHPDTLSGVQLEGLSATSADLDCGLCHQVNPLPRHSSACGDAAQHADCQAPAPSCCSLSGPFLCGSN